ncbi:MAG TPA: Flp pilus assembly protein CpaB [Bryobacteraceae bacterium]|nr:Flp pilus assembly protein CpaB [Bryobacteraceae bacterium]
MRFDRRFIIVVGCSLLWAFLVATVFYRMASNAGGSRRQPGRVVVVASQPLAFGALITAETVKAIQVPESLFPKDAFSRIEDVVDRSVVSPIGQDEPIVETRIAPKGSGIGLSPMIPPGLRAVAVRVNDVVGVAGYVLPGMRVDVLVTGHPPSSNDTVTTTVLQNIPVLSAGQTIQADTKGQPISATVVTLLVSPPQAEALTLANSEGRIQLVLRNNSDQQVIHTTGWQARELYVTEPHPRTAAPENPVVSKAVVTAPVRRAAAPPVSIVKTETPPAPRADEVIMIRGNQKTVEQAIPRTEPSK